MNNNISGSTYSIGLDLGGTNSEFGIVNKSGEILCRTSIKTQEYPSVEEFVKASLSTLQPYINKVGKENICSMGIGAPCGNYYTGCIENSANICWAKNSSVPIASMFSKQLGINVSITNDAKAAALGEMTFGCAQGMKNFIVITLGTGIGSGIVANGKLLYGKTGMAGELGHVISARENGRKCGCGRRGCLETYCSATGVVRTACLLLEKEDYRLSSLSKIPRDRLTSYDVFVAAGNGDKLAQEVYRRTGEILGAACADFATFLDPEAFIFFGGLTKAGDILMDPIRKAYDENVLCLYRGNAQFLLSGLNGPDAAVLGAAALGFSNK